MSAATVPVDGVSLPQTTLASSPFDDPKADVILRSSDNVDFHVHQILLSLVSPVFRDMFTLSQGNGTNHEGEVRGEIPIIPLGEDSHSLVRLLSWCDPRGILEWTLNDIQTVLYGADKYDMTDVTKRVEGLLKVSTHVEQDPIAVYAIAMRYKFEEVARVAAKHTLRLTLLERPVVPQLGLISGTELQHLHVYYFACGVAAKQVARDFAWIQGLNVVTHPGSGNCFQSSVLIAGATTWVNVQIWWKEYMEAAASALEQRPCGATITSAEFATDALAKANICPICGPKSHPMLREFNKLFAAEVERVVAQVSLDF